MAPLENQMWRIRLHPSQMNQVLANLCVKESFHEAQVA